MNQIRLDELTADFMATPTDLGFDLSFRDMAELCQLQIKRIDELEQLPTSRPGATPIDLSAFCDANADGGEYPGTVRPFQIADDPWLYSTNGQIAARTPAAPVSKPETSGRLPPSIGDMPWGGGSDLSWQSWPSQEWATNLQGECLQCGDTGQIKGCRCEDCLGSGAAFFQRVGEQRIQSHYDRLIRDLENVYWRLATNGMIAFQFVGGEGLVMVLDREKEANS